jgi:hypothetical protein
MNHGDRREAIFTDDADRAAAAPGDDHDAQVGGRTTGNGHQGKRGPSIV